MSQDSLETTCVKGCELDSDKASYCSQGSPVAVHFSTYYCLSVVK